MRKLVDQVNCLQRLRLRHGQQRRRHRHRERRAHHRQVAHTVGPRGGYFQRNQGTPAVPDERCFVHARGIQQCRHRQGGAFDRGGRITAAFAVTGQVDRQHIPAVVGQVAGLQNPHAVVVEHAVNEYRGGQRGVKSLAARVAESGVTMNVKLHRAPPPFFRPL